MRPTLHQPSTAINQSPFYLQPTFSDPEQPSTNQPSTFNQPSVTLANHQSIKKPSRCAMAE
eukprot:37025-Chlamydomonas_euryale.AAC.1